LGAVPVLVAVTDRLEQRFRARELVVQVLAETAEQAGSLGIGVADEVADDLVLRALARENAADECADPFYGVLAISEILVELGISFGSYSSSSSLPSTVS